MVTQPIDPTYINLDSLLNTNSYDTSHAIILVNIKLGIPEAGIGGDLTILTTFNIKFKSIKYNFNSFKLTNFEFNQLMVDDYKFLNFFFVLETFLLFFQLKIFV